MIDWTFALVFRPDITKVGLDGETAFVLREAVVDEMCAAPVGAGGAPVESAAQDPLRLAASENARPGLC